MEINKEIVDLSINDGGKNISPISSFDSMKTPDSAYGANAGQFETFSTNLRSQMSNSLLGKGDNLPLSLSGGTSMSEMLMQKGVDKFKEYGGISLENDYIKLKSGKYIPKYEQFMFGADNNERMARIQNSDGLEDGVWERGVDRFFGTTWTTGLGGLAGLPVGVASAISQGSLTAFYDNDFANWLDEQAEISKYNGNQVYYSQAEQDMSIGSSMGTSKFWADKVLGGAAFTVGTIGSEALWGLATGGASLGAKAGLKGLQKGLSIADKTADIVNSGNVISRAMKKVNYAIKNGVKTMSDAKAIGKGVENATRMGIKASKDKDKLNTLRFVLTSSAYEAGFEARNMKNESEKAFLDYHKENNGRMPSAEEWSKFQDELDSSAGMVAGLNMALLSVSNMAMFGKMFGVKNPFGNSRAISEGNAVTRKLFGYGVKTGENGAKEVVKSNFLQKGLNFLWKTGKSGATEGIFEEGGQGVASGWMKGYMESTYDPEAVATTLKETTGYLSPYLKEAFSEQFGTKAGQEEMVIGAIIGGVFGIGGTISDIKKGGESLQRSVDFDNNSENLRKGYIDNLYTRENILEKVGGTARGLVSQAESEEAIYKGQPVRAQMKAQESLISALDSAYSVGKDGSFVEALVADMQDMDVNEIATKYGIEKEEATTLIAQNIAEVRATASRYAKSRELADIIAQNIPNDLDRAKVVRGLSFALTTKGNVAEIIKDASIKISNILEDGDEGKRAKLSKTGVLASLAGKDVAEDLSNLVTSQKSLKEESEKLTKELKDVQSLNSDNETKIDREKVIQQRLVEIDEAIRANNERGETIVKSLSEPIFGGEVQTYSYQDMLDTFQENSETLGEMIEKEKTKNPKRYLELKDAYDVINEGGEIFRSFDNILKDLSDPEVAFKKGSILSKMFKKEDVTQTEKVKKVIEGLGSLSLRISDAPTLNGEVSTEETVATEEVVATEGEVLSDVETENVVEEAPVEENQEVIEEFHKQREEELAREEEKLRKLKEEEANLAEESSVENEQEEIIEEVLEGDYTINPDGTITGLIKGLEDDPAKLNEGDMYHNENGEEHFWGQNERVDTAYGIFYVFYKMATGARKNQIDYITKQFSKGEKVIFKNPSAVEKIKEQRATFNYVENGDGSVEVIGVYDDVNKEWTGVGREITPNDIIVEDIYSRRNDAEAKGEDLSKYDKLLDKYDDRKTLTQEENTSVEENVSEEEIVSEEENTVEEEEVFEKDIENNTLEENQNLERSLEEEVRALEEEIANEENNAKEDELLRKGDIKFYKSFVERLAKRFNINVVFTKDNPHGVKGWYDQSTNTAYLVEDMFDGTTAVHEIFGHPFLNKIKVENPTLYETLLKEASANKSITDYVDGLNYSEENKNDEYILRALDLTIRGEIIKLGPTKGLLASINSFAKKLKDFVKGLLGIDSVDNLPSDLNIQDIAEMSFYGRNSLDLSPSEFGGKQESLFQKPALSLEEKKKALEEKKRKLEELRAKLAEQKAVIENVQKKHDNVFLNLVKEGRITKEQALKELEKVGRKESEAYRALENGVEDVIIEEQKVEEIDVENLYKDDIDFIKNTYGIDALNVTMPTPEEIDRIVELKAKGNLTDAEKASLEELTNKVLGYNVTRGLVVEDGVSLLDVINLRAQFRKAKNIAINQKRNLTAEELALNDIKTLEAKQERLEGEKSRGYYNTTQVTDDVYINFNPTDSSNKVTKDVAISHRSMSDLIGDVLRLHPDAEVTNAGGEVVTEFEEYNGKANSSLFVNVDGNLVEFNIPRQNSLDRDGESSGRPVRMIFNEEVYGSPEYQLKYLTGISTLVDSSVKTKYNLAYDEFGEPISSSEDFGVDPNSGYVARPDLASQLKKGDFVEIVATLYDKFNRALHNTTAKEEMINKHIQSKELTNNLRAQKSKFLETVTKEDIVYEVSQMFSEEGGGRYSKEKAEILMRIFGIPSTSQKDYNNAKKALEEFKAKGKNISSLKPADRALLRADINGGALNTKRFKLVEETGKRGREKDPRAVKGEFYDKVGKVFVTSAQADRIMFDEEVTRREKALVEPNYHKELYETKTRADVEEALDKLSEEKLKKQFLSDTSYGKKSKALEDRINRAIRETNKLEVAINDTAIIANDSIKFQRNANMFIVIPGTNFVVGRLKASYDKAEASATTRGLIGVRALLSSQLNADNLESRVKTEVNFRYFGTPIHRESQSVTENDIETHGYVENGTIVVKDESVEFEKTFIKNISKNNTDVSVPFVVFRDKVSNENVAYPVVLNDISGAKAYDEVQAILDSNKKVGKKVLEINDVLMNSKISNFINVETLKDPALLQAMLDNLSEQTLPLSVEEFFEDFPTEDGAVQTTLNFKGRAFATPKAVVDLEIPQAETYLQSLEQKGIKYFKESTTKKAKKEAEENCN